MFKLDLTRVIHLQCNRRTEMIRNSRILHQNCNVEDIVGKYSAVLSQNYGKLEQELLHHLCSQVKRLKKELNMFKKELSCDNVEKLIIDKRRQKEKERQLLENRWRHCNQAFKTLQDEQKQLIYQQNQDAFDAKNLQKKIEQFRNNLLFAKNRAQTAVIQKQVLFLTQNKQNYQSPNKAPNKSIQKLKTNNQKMQLLLQNTSSVFLSGKYKLNKCHHLNFNAQNKTNLGGITDSSRFEHSFNIQKHSNQKINPRKTDRQSNLQRFLSDSNVRLKLFKIIKQQL